MKEYVYVPDLNNPNSTLRVSLEVTNDNIVFSKDFKDSKDFPKKGKTNKYGYTRESLLAKAKELYEAKRREKEELYEAKRREKEELDEAKRREKEELDEAKRREEEANRQNALLVRQSMFAETGGMAGACVMPTIALGVMLAFIAPITALFPSFIALAGVSTAIFLIAAIVGNIAGTLAGLAAEYMSRPEDSLKPAI